jgi:hypothetical protein
MSLPRTVLAGVLLALGAVLLLAGALLTDAARLLRPAVFADRVAASLADPAVADFVAVQLTDGVLRGQRDLTGYRPLLLAASRDVVRSEAFAGIVRGAARRAHAAVLSDVGRGLVLSVPDLEVVLRTALAGVPAVAQAIPDDLQLALTELHRQPAVRALVAVLQTGATLARVAPWTLAAGAALLVLGAWRMPDRRDALVGAGAALVAAALALWAIVPVGRVVVGALLPGDAEAPLRAAAAGAWNVALAGLPVWAMTYAGVGVVLAAAGSSLLERLDVRELTTWVHDRALVPPERPAWRLARGVALVAVGLYAVLAPRAALTASAVLVGLLIAFVGLRETFAVLLDAAPARLPMGRALAEVGEGWAVGGALVLALATGFALFVLLVGRPAAEARATRTSVAACNGAAALCRRRVDEVTFAGTHNSMAAADRADWLFPQQERGIPAQLADGIRALLVDVHRGVPVGTRVRTLPDADGRGFAGGARASLGAEGTAAAMRIRDRLTAGQAWARRAVSLSRLLRARRRAARRRAAARARVPRRAPGRGARARRRGLRAARRGRGGIRAERARAAGLSRPIGRRGDALADARRARGARRARARLPRERAPRRVVAAPGVRRDAGDAVRLPRSGGHALLRPAPRRHGGLAVSGESLDRDDAGTQAVARRHRQRVRPPARAGAPLRAGARPARERARGGLVPHRRRGPRRGGAERSGRHRARAVAVSAGGATAGAARAAAAMIRRGRRTRRGGGPGAAGDAWPRGCGDVERVQGVPAQAERARAGDRRGGGRALDSVVKGLVEGFIMPLVQVVLPGERLVADVPDARGAVQARAHRQRAAQLRDHRLRRLAAVEDLRQGRSRAGGEDVPVLPEGRPRRQGHAVPALHGRARRGGDGGRARTGGRHGRPRGPGPCLSGAPRGSRSVGWRWPSRSRPAPADRQRRAAR